MNKIHVILFFITVCICIQTGFSLYCWDCRSDTFDECGDPFNNQTLAITDCDVFFGLEHVPGVNKTRCRKTKQKATDGTINVIRSCIKANEVEDCSRIVTGTNILYCGTCDTKGCNGVDGQYYFDLWKTLIPLILTFILKH